MLKFLSRNLIKEHRAPNKTPKAWTLGEFDPVDRVKLRNGSSWSHKWVDRVGQSQSQTPPYFKHTVSDRYDECKVRNIFSLEWTDLHGLLEPARALRAGERRPPRRPLCLLHAVLLRDATLQLGHARHLVGKRVGESSAVGLVIYTMIVPGTYTTFIILPFYYIRMYYYIIILLIQYYYHSSIL